MALTIPVSEIVEKSSNRLLGKHESWGRVLLGDVATVLNGFAFKSAEFSNSDGVPLIRIRDVGKDCSETTYLGDYDARYVVEPGDLLVGMDGDFNCARWSGPRGLLNQRVCKITLKSDIYLPKFLDYTLPGYLKAINDVTSSVTVKHLSSKTIEEIPLPLPPIEVQQRLVAEIEKQFSRLDEAVANLKRVKSNLKRYKASILKAAVEGKLTEAWRKQHPNAEPASKLLERILSERRAKWNERGKYKEPTRLDVSGLTGLPDEWGGTTLETVTIDGPQNGLYLPQSQYGEGIPILRIDDFQDGWSRSSDELQKVRAQEAQVEAYSLKVDDLVINRVNSPSHLGKGVVVQYKNLPALFESNMMRLKLSAQMLPVFVAYYLRSIDGRRRLTKNAKWAVNQASINQMDVGMTEIPLPPIKEQEQIVAEVERRLSVIEELEAAVEANLTRADRLRQSILQKAFSGQLRTGKMY